VDHNDDLEALEGLSGDALGHLVNSGIKAGDLATFRALTPDLRSLVLRHLATPTPEDEAEFAALDPTIRQPLAEWMLGLPAYQRAPEFDPSEADYWEDED